MLKDDIKKLTFEKMKLKEAAAVTTLRMVSNEIINKEKTDKKELPDEAVIQLLKGMIKKRNDSISLYKQGGREELADKEQAEIDIINQFLPQQLSAEETTAIVKKTIEELGISSPKEMGKLMGKLKGEYGSVMDFSLVSKIVKESL
jgi:uncharacterized protein